MASFFEKLKKGMKTKETPQKQPVGAPFSIPAEKEKTQKNKETKKIQAKTKSKAEKEVREKVEEKLMKKKIKVKEEKSVQEKTELKKEKGWFESEGQLAVDVYQTDGEIVIQAAIAGISPDDLDISIENDVVTIRGNRTSFFEESKKNYFYQECYWGRFSREIILPEEIDPVHTTATMKQGILTIRLPKIEKKKRRKIAIKKE